MRKTTTSTPRVKIVTARQAATPKNRNLRRDGSVGGGGGDVDDVGALVAGTCACTADMDACPSCFGIGSVRQQQEDHVNKSAEPEPVLRTRRRECRRGIAFFQYSF